MQELLETKNIPALLTLIAVFLCASFVRGTIQFLWKFKEKKDSASEAAIKELTDAIRSGTQAIQHLDERTVKLENTLAILPKMKLDLRRVFSAVKLIAKDDWSKIRESIMDEESNL